VFHARYEVQLRLTKILADGGVPMIAGSDVTGASWEVPGAGLHQGSTSSPAPASRR
jgi:hypothetical protein